VDPMIRNSSMRSESAGQHRPGSGRLGYGYLSKMEWFSLRPQLVDAAARGIAARISRWIGEFEKLHQWQMAAK
jgi:hypothetical protein